MSRHYLAIDLGAESGRVMLGTLPRGDTRTREAARVSRMPPPHEIARGLTIAGRERGLGFQMLADYSDSAGKVVSEIP